MKAKLSSLAAGVALLLTTAPAFAHHPFADEFDAKKPVTLTGSVTKVDWTNPHAFAYVDVKDADGKVTNWKVEMGGVAALTHRGWRKTTLKTGDEVTIQGWQAKDGSNLANAKSVKLASGKTLSAASSYASRRKAATH